MLVEEFVNGYPVTLRRREAIPIMQKVRWRLNARLHPPRKPDRPPYASVLAYHWQPESGDYVNFGDELARVIVELMLARRGAGLLDEARANACLFTVGSVLHFAKDGATIWGTGLHGASNQQDHTYTKLDVRASRGPLTAKFLRARGIEAPDIYGDPGLLLPQLDQGRFRPSGQRSVGLVPNLHDMAFLQRRGFGTSYPDITIIDPRRAWNTVVEEILDHELILASSLHGLVVADAYGIPARYVRLTDKENILKYHDYYTGTGRLLVQANSIEEALEMGGAKPLRYDPAPLMSAFPYDLWKL